MAIYHLHLNYGSKGKGAPHASYIAAAGKYERKGGVVLVESGNMPTWAQSDPVRFWEAADEFERKNGVVYREIEVALPRELSREQQLELARELAQAVCGDKHAYTFAIHAPKSARDGKAQPHVHLMFSERIWDGIERDPEQYFKRYNSKAPERGGCQKSRVWQAAKKGKQVVAEAAPALLALRALWADMVNSALERAGVDQRVDHRSHVARGLDTLPEPKVGVAAWHMAQKALKEAEKAGKEPDADALPERWQKLQKVLASNQIRVSLRRSLLAAQQQEPEPQPQPDPLAEQIEALKQRINALYERAVAADEERRELEAEVWRLEREADIAWHRAHSIEQAFYQFNDATKAKKAAEVAVNTPWQRFLAKMGIRTEKAEKRDRAHQRRSEAWKHLVDELGFAPKNAKQVRAEIEAWKQERSELNREAETKKSQAYQKQSEVYLLEREIEQVRKEIRGLKRELEPQPQPQRQRQQDRGWELEM